MRHLPYDPIEGFTPGMLLTRSQGFGLIVPGDSRFRTLDQFLAAARAEPGTLNYGSSGIGNTTHVVGELFCRGARIQLTHVPYKTTPIQDAIAGTIDSFFVSPSLIMQYLQAGKLRMLGISSVRRMPQLPDVPSFGEYGIEPDIPGWSGFWGPAKLPPPIVDQLYKSLLKAAREKSFEKYSTHLPPFIFFSCPVIENRIPCYSKLGKHVKVPEILHFRFSIGLTVPTRMIFPCIFPC